jgi:hypothetical protein
VARWPHFGHVCFNDIILERDRKRRRQKEKETERDRKRKRQKEKKQRKGRDRKRKGQKEKETERGRDRTCAYMKITIWLWHGALNSTEDYHERGPLTDSQ